MKKIKRKMVFLALVFLIFFFLKGIAFPEEGPIRVPRFSSPPKIDGELDNPLWEEEALRIEDFIQLMPKEGQNPSEKTIAYLGHDEKNLYIAFRCDDSEPRKVRASVTNRDNCFQDDWVIVFLDTFNEKRRAFAFFLNPIGVQMDAMRIEEGGNDNMDPSWDMVFFSDGKLDEKGYTVEISLPFKSLRFPDREKKIWGLVMGRNIARSGEVIIWPSVTLKIPGILAQSKEILIQGKVEKGKNFELMPILTSLKTKEKNTDFEPGINFKWGINSDMTLDLTLNPDFSHIEADSPQIDINQRFALYYPEKRPFFLEGMEIFRFPEIEMLYTRRIIDPLAGARLTGKYGSFSYGLLTAYDANPTESLWEVHNGGTREGEDALFNIFRLKADVFGESYLGFCLADKEIDGNYNRVAGIDGQLRFKNKFFFSFQAIGSKTKFDEKETEIVPAIYSEFSYYSKYWGSGLWWKSIHPDFEAASGFVNRVDYRSYGMYTSFRVFPQKYFLNQIELRLIAGARDAYFEDIQTDRWFNARLHFRITEFNWLVITYKNEMERYAELDFYKNSLEIYAENSLIRWLPFSIYFRTGDSIFYDPEDPFLGWSNSYGLFFTYKPSNRIQISFDINKETFWEKLGGKEIYDYNVIRQRTTYQLSKALSLRTIVDYNHFYKKIYGSFLLSYILRPGTVFFFGLDNTLLRDEGGIYAQSGYSLFLKFSYWWRI